VMYRSTQRRQSEISDIPAAPSERTHRLRPLLRGALYALPAVFFPAAAGLLAGPSVLIVLVVSMTASWAISQGLAYLGYRRLGLGDLSQTKRLLRVGLAVCSGAVALTEVVTGLVVSAPLGALAFGAGQSAYMLGACVLTVISLERLLVIALAPGVLGSSAFLVLGRPAALEYAAWATLAATPLLAISIALVCTRSSTKTKRGRLLTATEFRDALPAAAFGLLAAGLLAFPVVATVVGHRHGSTGALLVAVPLSLSMGMAEWNLCWYRRRTQRLLRSAALLTGFGRRARLTLLYTVLQYMTTAGVLTLVVAGIAKAARLMSLSLSVLPELMAYLALGGAMFLCLLLQTYGVRHAIVAACAAALVFEVAFYTWGLGAQLVGDLGLFLFLGGFAGVTLGRARRHAN
jgi:hypothetical protein